MNFIDTSYDILAKHYATCLKNYGDTHKGMDWPNQKDAETRYRVMLEIANLRTHQTSPTFLDLGCGTARLLDWWGENNKGSKDWYVGTDINPEAIEIAKTKHPEVKFICRDLIREPLDEQFDYVIINGVFTEKLELSKFQMEWFFWRLLEEAWKVARRGVAFNIMSYHSNYQREDLFYMYYDVLVNRANHLTHDFVIRQDYGLYEYTTYLFKTCGINKE